MSKKQIEAPPTTAAQAPVVQAEVLPAELPPELEGTWGAGENLDSSDIKIPKIYHMQATSEFVAQGLAAPGDWVDSNTKEIICKRADKLPLIIFDSFKNIIVSTKGRDPNEKWKFKEYIPATPENVLLPWEEEIQGDAFGGRIKRQLQYNYFCMLGDKFDRLPYVLSLSSTKVQTAKILNSAITTLKTVLKKPSAAYIFNFLSVAETGEKGSWQGADVSQGGLTPIESLKLARTWYDTLKSTKFTIVESPEETTADTAAVEVHAENKAPDMDDGYMDSLSNQS